MKPKTDQAASQATETKQAEHPSEGGRYEYRDGQRVRVEEPTEHKDREPVRNAEDRYKVGEQPAA